MDEEIRSVPEYRGRIKPEFIAKATAAYEKYKADKEVLRQRVCDNARWYKANYWRVINPGTNEPQPATAYIFNAIEHKYADAVDNYPVPNLLEREPSDADTAKTLSKIIPVQLDICGFKQVYKDNWRRKLKYGTAVYGVFYNPARSDIDIQAVDLLNVYCDMYVKDVQSSGFLFITSILDNDILKEDYPKYAALFHGNAQVHTYDAGTQEVTDRTEVVDCYYKKRVGGKMTVHMIKLVDGHVIEATEDIEGYEDGLYEHGLYPVVFDVMYPDETSPFGFGVIDVVKNPQIYIDKLDAIISKNAMIAGKLRFMVKDNGGINENELKDLSQDIIHVAGGVSEDNIRQLQGATLDSFIVNHRQNKINELKEVIGNRDFQQGGTTGGVTAASAISVLQQAGEKLSRAMIDDSYDAYKNIIMMVIELVREFYTEERVFRITNEEGRAEYPSFSAGALRKPIERVDALGFPIEPEYRNVQFDIAIMPQKQNPFSKEANNQTLTTLWQMGFFNPQNIDMSLIVLQALQFDGKDKLVGDLQEYSQRQQQQQMQQAQQARAAQSQPSGGAVRDLGNGMSEIDLNMLG